jgi:hypothetical protein
MCCRIKNVTSEYRVRRKNAIICAGPQAPFELFFLAPPVSARTGLVIPDSSLGLRESAESAETGLRAL